MIFEILIGLGETIFGIFLWESFWDYKWQPTTVSVAEMNKIKKVLKIVNEENIQLKKMNIDFIQQSCIMLDINKEKEKEIIELRVIIEKYEGSFIIAETDIKKMTDILDSYKNNLQKLLHWKEQANKTMDSQAAELSKLKTINLNLLKRYRLLEAELKEYKKD